MQVPSYFRTVKTTIKTTAVATTASAAAAAAAAAAATAKTSQEQQNNNINNNKAYLLFIKKNWMESTIAWYLHGILHPLGLSKVGLYVNN